MKRFGLHAVCLVLIGFLVGCSSVGVDYYKLQTPAFVPEEHFVGVHRGQGVFMDRWGKVRKRFTVDLIGERTAVGFILREDLKYTDGETLKRVYNVTKIGEGRYRAEAEGLVRSAEISVAGNAMRWEYQLVQKIDGSDWTLSFDDWMFLEEDGVVLNRAVVTKWGVVLGEVVMSLRPVKEVKPVVSRSR